MNFPHPLSISLSLMQLTFNFNGEKKTFNIAENEKHWGVLFLHQLPKEGTTQNYFSLVKIRKTSKPEKETQLPPLKELFITEDSPLLLVNVDKREYVHLGFLPSNFAFLFNEVYGLGWEFGDRLLQVKLKHEKVLKRFKELSDKTREVFIRRFLKDMIDKPIQDIPRNLPTLNRLREWREFLNRIGQKLREKTLSLFVDAYNLGDLAIYGGLIPSGMSMKEFDEYVSRLREILETRNLSKLFQVREIVAFRQKFPSGRTTAFVFVKGDGGIYYSVEKNQPDSELISQVKRKENFRPRPFKLGSEYSVSADSCVMALLLDFAQKTGIDLRKVYEIAYPKEDNPFTSPMWRETTKLFAEWQGIEYPKEWNDENFEKLLEYLDEMNWHYFAQILEEEYENLKEIKEIGFGYFYKWNEQNGKVQSEVIVPYDEFSQLPLITSDKTKLRNWIKKILTKLAKLEIRKTNLPLPIKTELAEKVKVSLANSQVKIILPAEAIRLYLKAHHNALIGKEDKEVISVLKENLDSPLTRLLRKLEEIGNLFVEEPRSMFSKTPSVEVGTLVKNPKGEKAYIPPLFSKAKGIEFDNEILHRRVKDVLKTSKMKWQRKR